MHRLLYATGQHKNRWLSSPGRAQTADQQMLAACPPAQHCPPGGTMHAGHQRRPFRPAVPGEKVPLRHAVDHTIACEPVVVHALPCSLEEAGQEQVLSRDKLGLHVDLREYCRGTAWDWGGGLTRGAHAGDYLHQQKDACRQGRERAHLEGAAIRAAGEAAPIACHLARSLTVAQIPCMAHLPQCIEQCGRSATPSQGCLCIVVYSAIACCKVDIARVHASQPQQFQ